MGKNLIKDKLYELIDQFNEKKISHSNFMLRFLAIYIHFTMRKGELVT